MNDTMLCFMLLQFNDYRVMQCYTIICVFEVNILIEKNPAIIVVYIYVIHLRIDTDISN